MIKVKQITAVYIGAMLLLSGCGKDLTDSLSFEKIKTIELTAEEKEELVKKSNNTVSESIVEEKTEGTVYINGTIVSLSCPDGWSVRTWNSDSSDNSKDNSLYVTRMNTPNITLDVEMQQDLLDKDGTDLEKSLTDGITNLNESFIKGIDQILSDLEDAYTYYLKNEAYRKWKEVSFEKKTFHHQIYLMAKGRLKSTKKIARGKGACWYITIRDGNIITYQFTSDNVNIDDSMVSIFDGIMETVKYPKLEENFTISLSSEFASLNADGVSQAKLTVKITDMAGVISDPDDKKFSVYLNKQVEAGDLSKEYIILSWEESEKAWVHQSIFISTKEDNTVDVPIVAEVRTCEPNLEQKLEKLLKGFSSEPLYITLKQEDKVP